MRKTLRNSSAVTVLMRRDANRTDVFSAIEWFWLETGMISVQDSLTFYWKREGQVPEEFRENLKNGMAISQGSRARQ